MISLGIDTSAYTTSLVVMENQTILYEDRCLLKVKKGTVGLRQADAFFQHVQNLPELYKGLSEVVDIKSIEKIVVSSRPRPVEDSYMPVFTAGMRFAETVSLSLGIPMITLSHQENHLYAGLLDYPTDKAFIGVHISGGTSEILDVNQKREIKIIGDTLDLSFGKLIDRLGVYMGLDFPAGRAMDGLVSESIYKLKHSIKDLSFNISGIENQLKQHYDNDKDIDKVSHSLFVYLSELLIKVLDKAIEETDYDLIIMSGGVSANNTIRKTLCDYYGKKIHFTPVDYATDHAIGNAYYGNVVMTY